MELLYIREQDFHLASEEEQDDILSHYEKKNRKIWFKRYGDDRIPGWYQ